jgi:hypothetical protein
VSESPNTNLFDIAVDQVRSWEIVNPVVSYQFPVLSCCGNEPINMVSLSMV